MRTFVFVSHTADASGKWKLEDLCGAAGRVDVLCRNLQASMFLSHDLRPDVEAILVFVADPSQPTAVRFRAAAINRFNPDERSTAARIRSALLARPQDDWWEGVESGIDVAPFGLAQVLAETAGTRVVLDKDGDDLEASSLPSDPVFIMGDHQPLTDQEVEMAAAPLRISLGPIWYHGNHVASILNYTMDRAA